MHMIFHMQRLLDIMLIFRIQKKHTRHSFPKIVSAPWNFHWRKEKNIVMNILHNFYVVNLFSQIFFAVSANSP